MDDGLGDYTHFDLNMINAISAADLVFILSTSLAIVN